MSERPRYTSIIEDRIRSIPPGDVFCTYDFLDIAPTSAVNRALSRMAEQGMIRRIMQGIYDKPEYSLFLDEYSAPRADQVAKTLGRKFNWTIAPAEDTALNILHLSTQVPNRWVFVSDGPNRIYKYGNTEIEFKKRANREMTRRSYPTLLLIQALRAIGKDNITEEQIRIITDRFSTEEKKKIVTEAKLAPAWIYETIKEIFTEDRVGA